MAHDEKDHRDDENQKHGSQDSRLEALTFHGAIIYKMSISYTCGRNMYTKRGNLSVDEYKYDSNEEISYIPSPWGENISGADADYIYGWRAFQRWLEREHPEVWKQISEPPTDTPPCASPSAPSTDLSPTHSDIDTDCRGDKTR